MSSTTSSAETELEDTGVSFCRALYNYSTEDSASLSLQKGDIVQVQHRLKSGWWHGRTTDGRHGWFPSNYIVVVPASEATQYDERQRKVSQHASLTENSPGDSQSRLDIPPHTRSDSTDRMEELDQSNRERIQLSNDYWVPQVTPDSQVFYINPQTGRRALDLEETELNFPRISLGNASLQLALNDVEKLAQSLQQALLPAPPPTVEELVSSVEENLVMLRSIDDSSGMTSVERDRRASELLSLVVSSIRDLLRTTVPLTDPPPPSLLPRDAFAADFPIAQDANKLLQGEIRQYQNKIIATLSKLVLSARDASVSRGIPNGPRVHHRDSEIQLDQPAVTGLQLAVSSFVQEVQKKQDIVGSVDPRGERKRLEGVFQTAYIGLGLVGAGSAGTWRGFGWVTLEPGVPEPSRVLGSEVVSELRSYIGRVTEAMFNVANLLSRPAVEHSLDAILRFTQNVATQVSLFTQHINDVNMALYVDVDDPSSNMEVEGYLDTVRRARALVRSLELVLQAVYDDCAYYVLSVQSAHFSLLVPVQDALSNRMNIVLEIVQDMISTGMRQMELSREHYDLSIGLRSSRLGMVTADFAAMLSEIGSSGEPLGYSDPNAYSPGSGTPGRSRSHSESSEGSGSTFAGTPRSRSTIRPLPAIDPSVRVPDEPDWETPEESPRPLPALAPGASTRPELSRLRPVREEDEEGDGADPNAVDIVDGEVGPGLESPIVPRGGRAGKLVKVLGENAPEHYLKQLNAKAVPTYLRPDYSKSDMSITPDGVVRGGTLTALVEHLTAHELSTNHSAFLKTFLITYSSFTDLNTFFDLLVKRYRIQPPPDLTSTQLEEWTKLKQDIVRVRVMNIFKQMVSDEDFLEKHDLYILDRIREFLESPEVTNTAPARSVKLALDRRARFGESAFPKFAAMPIQGNMPPSIVPKTKKEITLLDIDPLELARQLTIRENNGYNKIRTSEYIRRSKESQSADEAPDNLARFIQTSNQIPNWIKASVLSSEDYRRRATIIKHFINLADRCRALNNFSVVFAIVTGLNTTPVRRLNRTWEQVNARSMTLLTSCEVLMESKRNFENYRKALAAVQPPCIPYIGRYLTELNFIHNGNKNMLDGNLINFAKRQKVAETIAEIKHWQTRPYNLNTVPAIQIYIENALTRFSELSEKDLDDSFYKLSLEREPREGEDDKMARLLQESGFL